MVLIYKFFIELSSYLFSNHPFKSLCESETAVSTWACETLLETKGCTSRELMCVKAQRWINMFRGCFFFFFLMARSLFLQPLRWRWPEFWSCLGSVPTATFQPCRSCCLPCSALLLQAPPGWFLSTTEPGCTRRPCAHVYQGVREASAPKGSESVNRVRKD